MERFRLTQAGAFDTLPGAPRTAIGGPCQAFTIATCACRNHVEVQYRFNRRFNLRAVLNRLLHALLAIPGCPVRTLRAADGPEFRDRRKSYRLSRRHDQTRNCPAFPPLLGVSRRFPPRYASNMRIVLQPMLRIGFARAAVLLWHGPAFAQVPASSAPALASSVVQMVLGLALVFALILGSLWLLKRLSVYDRARGGLLRIVAGIAVGPRERVVLVEVGDTWLVLGVAPGQVCTLHQLPRLEAAPLTERKSAPVEGFRGWLDRTLERKHAAK